MEHKKHKSHPHDKVAAMPQFNEAHWEKKPADTLVGGSRYASEMNTMEEYKSDVDGLANYVKKHKEKH
jgi:hypothetical protein